MTKYENLDQVAKDMVIHAKNNSNDMQSDTFVVSRPLKESSSENRIGYITSKLDNVKAPPTLSEDIDVPVIVSPLRMDMGVAHNKSIPVVKPIQPTVRQMETKPGDLPNTVDIEKSISKTSRMIEKYLKTENVFNLVKDHISGDVQPTHFYSNVQNCMYFGLLAFTGAARGITIAVDENTKHISTLHYFDRLYRNNAVSYEKNPTVLMEKYRRVFKDHDGIEPEWLDDLKTRILNSIKISEEGAAIITDIIGKTWCQSGNIIEEQTVAEVSHPSISIIDDYRDRVNVIQSPSQTEYQQDEDDDEDDGGEASYIKVEISENMDLAKVICGGSDYDRNPVYPFYTQLHKVPADVNLPSIAYDGNGIWDALIHFMPNVMFTTTDPSQYLENNNGEEVNDIKFVVLDVDEESGLYYCGAYLWKGICVIDDDTGEEMYFDHDDVTIHSQVMYLIKTNIGNGPLSHLERTLSKRDMFLTEEEVKDMIGDRTNALVEILTDTVDGESDSPSERSDDSEHVEESSEGSGDILLDAAMMAFKSMNPEDESDESSVDSSDEEVVVEAEAVSSTSTSSWPSGEPEELNPTSSKPYTFKVRQLDENEQ